MADETTQQGWFCITPENEGKYDIFRKIPKATTAALYKIDAADAAMAIPHIRIWKLRGNMYSRTNDKISPPLSDQFFTPPAFGQSGQFSERPTASIESIAVKKHNPGGYILFRELDIVMAVHRPDVLNDNAHDPGNVVNALLQPGNNFLLEYGWVGGKNAVLGAGLSHEEDKPIQTPLEQEKVRQWLERQQLLKHQLSRAPYSSRPVADPIEHEPKFYGTVFTAVQQMRFAVTNYNFTIMHDGQVKFNIHAIEDAELEVRSSTIFDQPGLPQPPDSLEKSSEYLRQITDMLGDRLKDYSFYETVRLGLNVEHGPDREVQEEFIELQDVLNVLFAMPIVQAVRGLRYHHVHLYTGVFNEFAPTTNVSLGAKDWAGQPIGNFWLRLSDVRGVLNKVISTKGQITVYNLLKQILDIIQSPGVYDLHSDRPTCVPEMTIYTMFNPLAGYARFQIVDRKRFLTIVKGVKGMHEHNVVQKKAEIIKVDLQSLLQANFIPYFTLYSQTSFFKDAKFDVVNDEHMKSIFMNRLIQKTREQISTGMQGETETNSGLPMGLLMYRSAVKGQVTTIGNFGFDVLGMVWVNFGVPLLDGFFYVVGKTDHVAKEGFTSVLTLQAEGSNPLDAKTYEAQVAEDNVKEKILLRIGSAFAKQLFISKVVVDPSQAAVNDAALNQSTTQEQQLDDARGAAKKGWFNWNAPIDK
jgi:hypothetical protein